MTKKRNRLDESFSKRIITGHSDVKIDISTIEISPRGIVIPKPTKGGNMSEIKLGDRVKDTISGLSGIVSAIHLYMFGCVRLTITPEGHKDGVPFEAFTIDKEQCKKVKKEVVKKDGNKPPAGPRNTPSTSRAGE